MTRRETARSAGLSYELIRHYERVLKNVLKTRKGANNQVMYDDEAREILFKAVELKRKRGFSMKQVFHYFNGTDRVDKEESKKPQDDEKDKRVNGNKKKPMQGGALVPSPVRVAAVVEGTAGSAQVVESSDADWNRIEEFVVSFRKAHDEITKEIAVIKSDNFCARLADGVGQRLEEALAGRFDRIDGRMNLLAEATAQLDVRERRLQSSQAQLLTICSKLAGKLDEVEERLKEAEADRPGIGQRLYRWFFGLVPKKDSSRPETRAKDEKKKPNQDGRDEKAQGITPDFVKHFERFFGKGHGRSSDAGWYLDYLGPLNSLSSGKEQA